MRNSGILRIVVPGFALMVAAILFFMSMSWYLHCSFNNSDGAGTISKLGLGKGIVVSSRQPEKKTNIVVVYTGRWQFLRVLLPYLHRDLRVNGGVIDEVWFAIIKCDENTMEQLTNFTVNANLVLNKNVFSIHINNPGLGKVPNVNFPYLEILPRINYDPNVNFFKMDDDIVYIHPDAFSNVLAQDDPNCLMYFFNIAGSHWRLNWIYQSRGVYNDPLLNPKNLTFGYDPHARCGWISPACNEMALRTFLHHHNSSSLDKLMFNHLEYLADKLQFSINAMLFNQDMIDLSAMIKTNHLSTSDEPWWTVSYTRNSKRANCIVGNALVVHFSYYKTIEYLLEKTRILQDFENIVKNNREQFKLDEKLWKLLEK